MTTVNIFDMADTWNDAGETFTAIKMDVTDTASNAASNLLDLQVGGVSRFRVRKDGLAELNFTGISGFNPVLNVGNGIFRVSANGFIQTATLGRVAARSFNIQTGGEACILGANAGGSFGSAFSGTSAFVIRDSSAYTWSSSNNVQSGTQDLFIRRDAADTLAQRRGTNPQEFRLYNTFTDASNFERLAIRWNSNVAEIKPEAGGTGSARVLHISGLPTSDPEIEGVLWNDAGTVKVSAG